MPLPWKKSKIDNKVSRLVSDLRSCNSKDNLVVQTGFPTSLVDLFVKNRDRINSKKKKTKKKKKTNHHHLSSDSDPIATPIILPPPPPISEFSVSPPPPLHNQRDNKSFQEDVSVVPNSVLKKLCFTIFLMSILALGTKKLVLAFTLFSFLLLVVELAGKRFPCCTDARAKLHSLFQTLLASSLHFDQSNFRRSHSANSVESVDDDDLSNVEEDMKICRPNDSDDLFKDTTIRQFQESPQHNSDIAEYPNLGCNSKRKKVSAKSFKKFVIKKFRKKKNKEKCEADLSKGETLEEAGELEEEEDDDDHLQVEGSYSSYNSELSWEVEENVGKTVQWDFEQLLPLVLILIGLLCGRLVALVLTVTWYLLTTQLKVRRQPQMVHV